MSYLYDLMHTIWWQSGTKNPTSSWHEYFDNISFLTFLSNIYTWCYNSQFMWTQIKSCYFLSHIQEYLEPLTQQLVIDVYPVVPVSSLLFLCLRASPMHKVPSYWDVWAALCFATNRDFPSLVVTDLKTIFIVKNCWEEQDSLTPFWIGSSRSDHDLYCSIHIHEFNVNKMWILGNYFIYSENHVWAETRIMRINC